MVSIRLFIIFSFIILNHKVFSSSQESDLDLTTLVAGHLRDRALPKEANQVLYTVVVKNNQMSLRIWENLFQGQLKFNYPLISVADIKSFKPYIVPDCLEEGYRYLLAGDIFKGNRFYFQGLLVGVPDDSRKSLYLCSIKKNSGLQSRSPNRDLGPFELAYRKVVNLEMGKLKRERLHKLLWSKE